MATIKSRMTGLMHYSCRPGKHFGLTIFSPYFTTLKCHFSQQMLIKLRLSQTLLLASSYKTKSFLLRNGHLFKSVFYAYEPRCVLMVCITKQQSRSSNDCLKSPCNPISGVHPSRSSEKGHELKTDDVPFD